jgi:hypothetical protein
VISLQSLYLDESRKPEMFLLSTGGLIKVQWPHPNYAIIKNLDSNLTIRSKHRAMWRNIAQ